MEQLKEKIEDEQIGKADLQRQLVKAQNEVSSLKQKLEQAESNGIQPEELEDLKRKMGVKIQDGEAQLESALSKLVGLDKLKTRLQMEVEALALDLEKVI